MTIELDCRNIDCPGPVMKTKQAIEEQGATSIKIIVDNDAAVENVTRFLNFHDFEVSVESSGRVSTIEGRGSRVQIKKTGSLEKQMETCTLDSNKQQPGHKIMVLIGASTIGRGDDGLGAKLMTNFLKTLGEMGSDLWRIAFVNDGVKLTVNGSSVLTVLEELEKEHTDILVCGACLTHFDLLDQKAVGDTTNMLDIVTSMQLADKVINL